MTQHVERGGNTPHVFLVAGGGAWALRSTVLLRLMADHLESRGIAFTAIDGLYADKDDNVTVKSASQQTQELQDAIAARAENERVLIVSHCLGTVAAVSAVEQFASQRRVKLVSAAPPLPSPADTVSQPQSRAKRINGDTTMKIGYFSEPVNVLDRSTIGRGLARIHPNYLSDIRKASDLEPRLRLLVEEGLAVVFAAGGDWNSGSPDQIQTWQQEWQQTLPQERVSVLQERVNIMPYVGHGFYPSGLTWEQTVGAQAKNGAAMIDAGLQLLEADHPY